jgi:formimidoylglutamate deiminase
MTTRYFAELAFLPTGWANHVRIEVNDAGTITDVARDAERDAAATFLGAVVPGMPNVHSHAFQRARAGQLEFVAAERETFWTWRDGMYDLAMRVTPDDVQGISTYLYIEMLEAGYTSVGEFHYLHNDPSGTPYASRTEMADRLLAAAQDVGIGMTLLLSLYRRADFGADAASPMQRRFVTCIDDLAEIYRSLRSRTREYPRIRIGIAPHSLRAVSVGDLRELLNAFEHESVPVHIHIAEQQQEVDACIEHLGSRPVAWLLANAPVSEMWTLVHATHVTREELTAIARSGAIVALCPTTEANLGDGIFPIGTLIESNSPFAIGSDSHVAIDPAEELRLIEYGQRLYRKRRGVLVTGGYGSVAQTLYPLAVAGGTRALADDSGALQVGRRADFVSLDLDNPLLAGCPPESLLDVWLFGGTRGLVKDVIVAGRQVVTNGSHPRRDEAARKYRETMKRLAAHAGPRS